MVSENNQNVMKQQNQSVMNKISIPSKFDEQKWNKTLQFVIKENKSPLVVQVDENGKLDYIWDLIKKYQTTTYLCVLYSKLMGMKLYTKDNTELKVGDPITIIYTNPETAECLQQNYTETYVDDNYENVIEILIDDEDYEMCEVIQSLYNQYKNNK